MYNKIPVIASNIRIMEMKMAEEVSKTPQPSMNILAQFIRDMSFENILAQKGIEGEVSPDVQVQVSLDAKKRTPENQFEVVVKLKIDSKSKNTC